MKVGIRFGDNDFSRHIEAFLKLYIIPNFVEREGGHMVTHLTTSMITDLFNLYMPHLYTYNMWCWENEREYLPRGFDHHTHMGKYLQITEFDVYWDNKTDDYIGDWDTANNNSEFIWTDGKEVFYS
jgi:hypothetical protein